MTVKEIIEKAVYGGYEPFKTFSMQEGGDFEIRGDEFNVAVLKGGFASRNIYNMFLDPLFWAAVGKVEGWDKEEAIRAEYYNRNSEQIEYIDLEGSEWRMHQMMNAFLVGKTLEQFLATL